MVRSNKKSVISFLVSTGSFMMATTAAVAAVPEAGQYYEIVALHSKMCVDVKDASIAHGAPVVQANCWGGGNQKWQLVSVGSGYYEIVVQHSHKCLDVAYSSLAHGAAVIQADCWGGTNQQWRLVSHGLVDGDELFEIIARHSQKCLDVAYMSREHAAPIIQGDCWVGTNQLFTLHPVAP